MYSVETKSKGKITIDLYALSVADVRALLDKKSTPHDGDVILSKAVGLTVEELTALPYPDYRKLTKAFWKLVNDPLSDEDDAKNSQSESTSP